MSLMSWPVNRSRSNSQRSTTAPSGVGSNAEDKFHILRLQPLTWGTAQDGDRRRRSENVDVVETLISDALSIVMNQGLDNNQNLSIGFCHRLSCTQLYWEAASVPRYGWGAEQATPQGCQWIARLTQSNIHSRKSKLNYWTSCDLKDREDHKNKSSCTNSTSRWPRWKRTFADNIHPWNHFEVAHTSVVPAICKYMAGTPNYCTRPVIIPH